MLMRHERQTWRIPAQYKCPLLLTRDSENAYRLFVYISKWNLCLKRIHSFAKELINCTQLILSQEETFQGTFYTIILLVKFDFFLKRQTFDRA